MRSIQDVQFLKRSLVDTFRDDFAKYAAQLDPNVYKLLHLDAGLLTMMSGLTWTDIAWPDARALVNEGALAEQFAGQELLAAVINSPDGGLYSLPLNFAGDLPRLVSQLGE